MVQEILNQIADVLESLMTDYNAVFVFIKCVIYGLLCSDLLLNGAVIYSVIRFKKMRTKINIFLMNFALISILYSLTTTVLWSTLPSIIRHQDGLCLIINIWCALFLAWLILVFMFGSDEIFQRKETTFARTMTIMWIVFIVHFFIRIFTCPLKTTSTNLIFFIIFLVTVTFFYVGILVSCCLITVARRKTASRIFRFKIICLILLFSFMQITGVLMNQSMSVLNIIGYILIFANKFYSICNIILLVKIDKNFNVCLSYIFSGRHGLIENNISYEKRNEYDETLMNQSNQVILA